MVEVTPLQRTRFEGIRGATRTSGVIEVHADRLVFREIFVGMHRNPHAVLRRGFGHVGRTRDIDGGFELQVTETVRNQSDLGDLLHRGGVRYVRLTVQTNV